MVGGLPGCLVVCLLALSGPAPGRVSADTRIPILVYHRLGARVTDSMTVRTATFESHLRSIREAGYRVISLRQLVECRRGLTACPVEPSIVLTVDDAHRSVYTDMLPMIRRHRVPITLFAYPSAISRADYAMTWEQLRELRDSGWFDIQSHTFWHPNFNHERKRLPAADYERFVRDQLTRSRRVLEEELGIRVDLLSWPFGIFDDRLIALAEEAGYVGAVTLERRHSSARDPVMALPRYLVSDTLRGNAFNRLLAWAHE